VDSVERTIIGFMGCYAAMNALKLARHIVRSEKSARVLVLSLELCSLHLKETTRLDEILSFLIFADGCAASIVSADPSGLALDSFRAVLVPETQAMITWNIGDMGFDMFLSGQVPATIQEALKSQASEILAGSPVNAFDSWAVHPGGRSVLDAVERALDLKPEALAPSRAILRRFGNMSSATVMFVLEAMLRSKVKGARGCAMSFGPGLIAEDIPEQLPAVLKAMGDRLKIDIPSILLHLRSQAVRVKAAPGERLAMRSLAWLFDSVPRFTLAQRFGRLAQRLFVRGGVISRLPPPLRAWTRTRDLKPVARETFRMWWKRERR
jgi:hypothetical protein